MTSTNLGGSKVDDTGPVVLWVCQEHSLSTRDKCCVMAECLGVIEFKRAETEEALKAKSQDQNRSNESENK